MAAREYLEAVIATNNRDIDTRLAQLRSGSLPYEEYKNVCGQIRGLELANDNTKSLLQNLEKDDE